jgi:simple sugar transport system substrate-binding protein
MRALRDAGGNARVLGVDDQSDETPRHIANAIKDGNLDGVLSLNATTGIQTVKAVDMLAERPGTIKVGTFDLGPDVLRAVQRGRLLFAVDQQAYLQGYLPIVLLAERARYGLFPAQGDVLPTGPNFVTAANAGQAIELSKRSIR